MNKDAKLMRAIKLICMILIGIAFYTGKPWWIYTLMIAVALLIPLVCHFAQNYELKLAKICKIHDQ